MEQTNQQPEQEKDLQFFLDEVAKEETDYEFWNQVENAFTGDRDFSTELAQYELESHKRFHAYQIDRLEKLLSKSQSDTFSYRNLYRESLKEITHENDLCKEFRKEINLLKEQFEEAKKESDAIEFAEWHIKQLCSRGPELACFTTQDLYKQFKQNKP